MLFNNRNLKKRISKILVLMVIFKTSLYNLGFNRNIFAIIFIILFMFNLGQFFYQRKDNYNE